MDLLAFVAKIVEALAWPGAALVIVVLLRSPIGQLVPLLRRLKAGPIEAVFEQEIESIKDESEDVGALPPVSRELDREREMLRQLAAINPRSAILQAWSGVEIAARRAAMNHAGSPPPDVKSPLRTVRYLTEMKLLDQNDIGLFHDLRGLRNQAAHVEDFSPSYASAIEYIDLAKRLESRFLELARPGH
jgi:hypothetical protein